MQTTKRFLVTDCDTIIGVYEAADHAGALDRYADDIGYADHAERVREAKFVGMLDMIDVVAIELVDDQVHVVFLEPTVTQVVHGDTRITCEHATQRTAEVYAVVEMLRSAGWSVRGPGSGDGFRRPLLLARESMMTALDGAKADLRAQGFAASRGSSALTVDACAGLDVVILHQQGDVAEALALVETYLG